MELTWIEDFLALSRTQNFTEAAAQRNATQSAFSRRIQQLEEWLGTTLVDRDQRPVRLTEAGSDFLRRAQRLREDMMDARRIAMASQSNYRQTVRVYTTTALAVGVLPAWLKRHGASNHTILTSSTGGCVEALRQKRADKIVLPLFEDDVRDTQLQYTQIAEDALVPYEKHGTRQPLSLRDKTLAGPLLMHTPGTIFGQQMARRWAARGLGYDERAIVCESASAEALLALVRQGLGAAWLPRSLAEAAGRAVARCAVPEQLDVSYAVMLITRPLDEHAH